MKLVLILRHILFSANIVIRGTIGNKQRKGHPKVPVQAARAFVARSAALLNLKGRGLFDSL